MLRALPWNIALFCSLCAGYAAQNSIQLSPAHQPSAAELARALREMSVDPEQTYRVRDLTLARGDIKIYLTEGILSLATPVAGHCVAAVFTTAGVDAGDGEILLLPPQRSERASLASFIHTPNLDQHFTSAAFLFTDDTLNELLAQIKETPVRKAPEVTADISTQFNPVLREMVSGIDIRLVQSLLDNHKPEHGLLYSAIFGRELGAFDVIYEPDEFEPIAVGRSLPTGAAHGRFQLWTAFRPRHNPAHPTPPVTLSNFSIDAAIHPDLSMSVSARFDAVPNSDGGRVISLGLSERLKVLSATVDGKAVEVFQRGTVGMLDVKSSGTFLLVSAVPLDSGKVYNLEVRYEGSVIRQAPDGSYFVDERNAWFPYSGPLLTNFDLTFRCPERLRLVSTGEPVSDAVIDGIRTVHRKTQVPERLAGFNLGDYSTVFEEHGRYRIECYANRATAASLEKLGAAIKEPESPDARGALQKLPKETESVLDDYTQRWVALPIHSVAVSPIPGYFGQGFPGLIYLSTISYLRQQDRPSELRSPRMDTFFSEMLLPHEVAHQWWGNIVGAADYRTEWLMEAMANYSALQFLERSKGTAVMHEVLATYRDDLTKQQHGKLIESIGPVDFGVRLQQAPDLLAWHTIVYEKGTWILHMLRQRLGDDGFAKMQVRLLRDFAAKPLSNEDFRKVASDFVPGGRPDKALTMFFDTWIYGTGIPTLRLQRAGRDLKLNLSGVDEDFTADLALECTSKAGKQRVEWIRAGSGTNDVELPPGTTGCQLPSSNEFLHSP
ncbi:MAG: M1 family metallopeptidase [Bryobacteraceae bacterium]